MTVETFRHGYYATYSGVEYEASPAPDGTVRLYAAEPGADFEQVHEGRYRRVVPAAATGPVRHVRTVAECAGLPVVLIGAHRRWLRVEYTGADPAAARQHGFEEFEPGVYQGWIDRETVSGQREVID